MQNESNRHGAAVIEYDGKRGKVFDLHRTPAIKRREEVVVDIGRERSLAASESADREESIQQALLTSGPHRPAQRRLHDFEDRSHHHCGHL